MILSQLLPDQIANSWDVTKRAIEASTPPTTTWTPNMLNKILTSLLCGRAQCWFGYTVKGDNRKLEAVLVTSILYDDISDTRNLLIYSLFSYGIDRGSWIGIFRTLVKYAAAKNCKRIVAYTSEPGIINLAKKLGGETSQTFISLPLTKE